jgi:hypothetical protein
LAKAFIIGVSQYWRRQALPAAISIAAQDLQLSELKRAEDYNWK